MTALEKYIRLEALGQWRETPAADLREVVVSFGDATLVLTDLAERPLGHWALAGVQAIGAEAGATVYAMTPEGAETLTIGDRDMTEAIAAVTRAHLHRDARRPAPPRRRRWGAGLLALVGLSIAASLLPDLAREQAARMVPPEALAQFGDEMLLQLIAAHGAPCTDANGGRALAVLTARVSQGASVQVRAMDLGRAAVALLPGPTVVVGREAIVHAQDAGEIAGWIALALAREDMRPAPQRLMASVGPLASLRYALTGRLGEQALAQALPAVLAAPNAVELSAAYERLRGAGLATAPFAAGLQRSGLMAPPGTAEGGSALGDQDWVALQGLCG